MGMNLQSLKELLHVRLELQDLTAHVPAQSELDELVALVVWVESRSQWRAAKSEGLLQTWDVTRLLESNVKKYP